MNDVIPLLALIVGAWLGGLAVWLVAKARIAGAAAQMKAELQPQLATLAERVEAKEQQMAQLQLSLAAEVKGNSHLASGLQEQSNARAAAEQKCKHLAEQLELQAKELERIQNSWAAERQRLAAATVELASASAQLDAERKAHGGLEQKYQEAGAEQNRLQEELLAVKRQNGELAERARYLEERLATQRQEIEGIQQRFQKEFEAIAHKLLLENAIRFGQQSTESLDKLLTPLRENLKDFQSKLDSVQQDTSAHNALLKDQIARIGTEAANLSKALKGDVKVLGNWGENMLDQILERSGLQQGVHYRRQSSMKDDAGEQLFLDVVVELPEDRHLVIDSKVSLKSYEEYVNCSDDAVKGRHLEAHINCVRNHFRGLSAKRYHEIHGLAAPDFVLMYIPIEAAFFVAVGQEPGLFSEALERNVVLITNSTLLATLRTVAHVWRLADQQKHALEIAERGGRLYDKFVGFVTDLQGIGAALRTAREAWAEANRKLHQGAGNLINQVEKLRSLGVKASKKLPAQLASTVDSEDKPALAEGDGKKIPDPSANETEEPRIAV